MTRNKSYVVALCLAGLCSCIAISQASAMTMHECKETNEGGTGVKYSDSGCSKVDGTGKFQTVTLKEGQTVEVTPTSTETFLSQTVLSGIKFKFHCEEVTGSAKTTNSYEEVEPPKKNMYVQGSGKIQLQQCTKIEPAGLGCTIPTEIETTELQLLTSAMTTAYTPKEGTTLATIKISGCEGAAKALNGEHQMTGKLVAVTEEATPTSQQFTATSGSEVQISGAAATFEGKLHYATKASGQTLAIETP
jgi:hypothetical protein